MQQQSQAIGVALHGYHTAYGTFPPSSVWKVGGKLDISQIESSNSPNLFENWIILILPQLEQQNLRNQFDLTQPIGGPNAVATNRTAGHEPVDRALPFRHLQPHPLQRLGKQRDQSARG